MVIKGIRVLMGVGEVVAPAVTASLAIELLFRPGKKKMKPKHESFWNRGELVTFPSGCEARIFGKGDQVLWLVHGWQSHSSRFSKTIELGIANGFKVIAWNGPAHGKSQGRRTNLAEFTRALLKDINAYESKISVLIGHSFGAAASAYASSLGAKVDNLVLLAAPANARDVFERFWDYIGLETKSRQIFATKTQREMLAELEDMSLDNFVEKLSQNILLIHDEDDQIIPYSDAKRVAEQCSRVSLHTTNGLGHYKLVGARETLNEVDRFLKQA